jgi:flavin reductase (DIM6/NTAB) family NADH-FMN oxidoreductase RutF
MARSDVAFGDHFDEFCEGLRRDGLLLVSLDESGRANAMAIGWATLGIIWGREMCLVLVRPSRYTHGCIEATGDFTVNVPPPELAEQVLFCGTKSGRDHDKFAECGFTATPGREVKSPTIGECVLCYECTVVQKNDVIPEQFAPQVVRECYGAGDFHRVYYGEIVATYADIRRL